MARGLHASLASGREARASHHSPSPKPELPGGPLTVIEPSDLVPGFHAEQRAVKPASEFVGFGTKMPTPQLSCPLVGWREHWT